jgi:hypothetical protein
MISAPLFEPARVWLQRGALDRRIAGGADTSANPRLARRARQLTSRRCRRGLAQGLRNLVDAAEEPARAVSAAVPLQRREILREQGFLLALAVDLESDDEISARGVALIEDLLTNGGSPLYTPLPEGALRDSLTHAHAALYLA